MSFAARLLVVASLAVPVAMTFAVPAVATEPQAPVVTQVVPVQGSTVGYTDVVINGSGFTRNSSVVIGGFDATHVRVLSSRRIAVFAPPHGHGVKNVVVHTSHGTSKLSKAATFNYLHATLPGSWTSSRAALPADAGQYDDLILNDTSCPSVSTCYSVGRIDDDYDYHNHPGNPPTSGDRPVIRTRTGSSYSLVDAPLPADADRSDLSSAEIDAIDCPAVGSCAAIGRYPAAPNPHSADGYTDHVMLLTLSDGVWHAQAAPTGSIVTSTDDVDFGRPPGVSCGAPGACLVGVYLNFDPQNGTVGVLYRLSGTTWTGVRPVVPSGAKAFGVEHVSCPTATFCAAALASLPNSYLDVLTDNRLTPEAVHAPSGTSQTNYRPDVFGLQCPAAQDCVAVVGTDRGEDYYDTDFLRLIGSDLAGQAHHRIPTPGDIDPENAFGGYLTVSELFHVALVCPSTTTCFTTNRYTFDHRKAATQSVVARLAGSTVHAFVMPEAAGTGDVRTTVYNLACPSVTSCVAVGSRGTTDPSFELVPDRDDPAAAYVTFADGVWTPGSLPTVTDQPSKSLGQFFDLDCPAVGHCFADADYAWAPRHGGVYEIGVYARSTDLDAVLTPN